MRLPLVLLCGLLWAAPAAADDALRARVVDLLSAYETPPSAEDWRALGVGAGAEVFAVAKDPGVASVRRQAAVYALGHFPTADHRAWLGALVADDTADRLLRRQAPAALALGWGESALPELSAALAAPDAQLRAQAARALGRVGTASARAALDGRLIAETDPMVKDALRGALGGK